MKLRHGALVLVTVLLGFCVAADEPVPVEVISCGARDALKFYAVRKSEHRLTTWLSAAAVSMGEELPLSGENVTAVRIIEGEVTVNKDGTATFGAAESVPGESPETKVMKTYIVEFVFDDQGRAQLTQLTTLLANALPQDVNTGNLAVVTGGFVFSVVRVVAPQTDGRLRVYGFQRVKNAAEIGAYLREVFACK